MNAIVPVAVRTVLSSRWFKLAASLALLAVLLAHTDLTDMRRALAEANIWWLVVALGGHTLSQIISAYRWQLLARPLGFVEPFRLFCIYYFSGMYLNLFGPGTVTGDVGRTLFLAGGKRRTLALTSVVAHRAIGFVALAWIAAVAVLVLPDQPLPALACWAIAASAPATIVGWLWGPLLAARLLPERQRWRVFIERDLEPYWKDRRLLALSVLVALIPHFLQFAAQMVIAWSLNLDLPWTFFFVVVPVVGVAGMLPVSLSGVGVREAAFWYFLSRIGVPHEAAIALGLLTSAVVLASGITGLPAFLLLRQQAPAAAEPVAGTAGPADS